MKNTILHPTDFSKCANNALNYAIMVAKAFKCKIKIVHSLDFSDVNSFKQHSQDIVESTKLVEQDIEKKIQELGSKVLEQGIDYETEIFTGKIKSWLPNYIKENKPKLVVMGTTGVNSIANKVMGSNTFSIIKERQSPLLAVPESAEVTEFKKFIFSSDYKNEDIDSIAFMAQIANFYNITIDVVHILNDENAKKDNNRKLLDNLQKRTLEKVDYSNLTFRLLRSNNVHQRLQTLIKESEPALLALVMQNQNFFERLVFGSLTKKLAYTSQVPLLVFPAEN